MEFVGPEYTYNSPLWYLLLGGGLTQILILSLIGPQNPNLGKPPIWRGSEGRVSVSGRFKDLGVQGLGVLGFRVSGFRAQALATMGIGASSEITLRNSHNAHTQVPIKPDNGTRACRNLPVVMKISWRVHPKPWILPVSLIGTAAHVCLYEP